MQELMPQGALQALQSSDLVIIDSSVAGRMSAICPAGFCPLSARTRRKERVQNGNPYRVAPNPRPSDPLVCAHTHNNPNIQP